MEFGLHCMIRQPSVDTHVIWVAKHKVTRPQTILKFRPPSSMDYRTRHGSQSLDIGYKYPLIYILPVSASTTCQLVPNYQEEKPRNWQSEQARWGGNYGAIFLLTWLPPTLSFVNIVFQDFSSLLRVDSGIRHSPQLCNSSTYTASSWKRNIKTRFASKTTLINAKRGLILSILCLMLVSLEFLVAAPEPFLCINNLELCPWSLALDSLSARLLQT
jgi:hypothetical protein